VTDATSLPPGTAADSGPVATDDGEERAVAGVRGRGPRKKAAHSGAAKFREETSKKADSATSGRIAAVQYIRDTSYVCK